MLPAVLELNTSLKKLNLETNYLSGKIDILFLLRNSFHLRTSKDT